MPEPKELGPAQPRIDAGRAELDETAERLSKKPPAAGPHADKSLINEDATPGTGMLPEPNVDENDPVAPSS